MALHDRIRADIRAGFIPQRFRPADLLHTPDRNACGRYLIDGESYARSSLRTTPANFSVSRDRTVRGAAVARGENAHFLRLGGGFYELIHTSESSYEILCVPGDGDWRMGPVETVFWAIEIEQFQYYFKKQRKWHPPTPVQGWQARLESYFWPRLENGWVGNSKKIKCFVDRFSELEQGQDGAQQRADLLKLFKDICEWGRVSLPEADADRLFDEVFRALKFIDRNQLPKGCRLNSAWTKLYAMARPEKCVIYDSRVSASLLTRLNAAMPGLTSTREFQPFHGLGVVSGRGGSRPRELRPRWSDGYGSWKSQFAASRFCIALMEMLNREESTSRDRDAPWTLREVEAVLFMDGY